MEDLDGHAMRMEEDRSTKPDGNSGRCGDMAENHLGGQGDD